MSCTVGTTRFEVRDRYFRRLRDLTDPKCAYEETCFYSAHKEMPKAEQIATALLQLRNNPAFFDGWAHQCGLVFESGRWSGVHPCALICSRCESEPNHSPPCGRH